MTRKGFIPHGVLRAMSYGPPPQSLRLCQYYRALSDFDFRRSHHLVKRETGTSTVWHH